MSDIKLHALCLFALFIPVASVAHVETDIQVEELCPTSCEVCSTHPSTAPIFYHKQRTDGTGASLQQVRENIELMIVMNSHKRALAFR